ncbi:MAG: type I secretion C-terminal target domain-containing protein [Burkholderiales bacterium]|nr:type I secretion C-terminal target domain-containing protein [Burkholderiales bacterium]
MHTLFSRSQNSSYLNILSVQTTKNTENGREKTNTSFVFTFSEAIQKGSGSITITDRYGTIFLQENIDSAKISIDGNKLTFTPGIEFAFATSYDLRLSDGLVKSLVGTTSLTGGWTTYFQTDYSTIPVNITGTIKDDTIEGGYANDTLNGGTGGADRINGRDGDDIIVGGDETGTTFGGGDSLFGGKGNDTISGNGGDDYIEGEDGNDKLFGNEGNDRIDGGNGDDEIDGGPGDDYIEDRYGSKNIIKGGDGNDTIRTGTYALNVFGFIDGGNGNDKFYVGAFDTVSGGAGDDTFDISAFANDNSMGKYSGGAGNDIFIFNNMYRSTGGAEISGGEGIDTYAISQYYDHNANFVVTDFKTGPGGDKFDLSKMTKDNSIAGNPFATNGYLKLIQEGADTLLQRVNFGDSTNPTYTILRLKNVQATSLTAENFIGNINPNGGQQGLTLNGTLGNDQIAGNILDDTISGGDGNDRIEGGGGNDSLFGEAGDDYLYGEGGDDLLDGGAGNDTLEDNLGQNILKGGAGDDILKSSAVSPCTLEGGSGNDTISGGESITATLLGNEGNDQIFVYSWSYLKDQLIQVDGGAGEDVVTVRSGGSNTATIQIAGGTERDKFVVAYQFYGTILITDFSTKDGEILDLHTIFPSQPNGNPFGSLAFLKARQEANDTVISIDYDGAAGTNYIFRDFITLKNIKLTDLNGVHFYGNWNPNGSSIGLTLDGTENEDTLVGSDLNDVIRGFAGADRINGGLGDDTIYGGDEARGTYGDRIEGGKGNDILFGGNGNDELFGDEGNDQLSGDQGSDRLIGGLGNDTLDGGDDNDSLSDSDGDNILLGGAGNDNLSSDSKGKSILNGGAGDDYITSTNGNNTLIGGSGNDSFSVGRDSRYDYLNISISISGDDGNDIIQFYDSSSICVVTAAGGSGTDTYRLNSRSENKSTLMISDFTTGVGGDVINVFELLYSSNFIGNPFGSAGFLRLQQVGTDTVLELDMDGATGKEYGFQPLVTLKNVLSNTLVPANFTEGLNPDGSPTGLAITGSDTGDDLKGGRLDDTIYGMAGNDIIYGYSGSDKIFGGDGDDSIYGDKGDDDLDGGNGNDTINDLDSFGANTLSGGDGNDYLSTASSNKNLLRGGNGNDQFTAGNGNDTLLGENGDDTFIISNGSFDEANENAIHADGGDGNDKFTVSITSNRKSTITVVGGDGIDTYQISRAVGNSTYTVLDFKTGTGGDIINFNFILPYGFNLGNPFGKLGLLRALQNGLDTTLQ